MTHKGTIRHEMTLHCKGSNVMPGIITVLSLLMQSMVLIKVCWSLKLIHAIPKNINY